MFKSEKIHIKKRFEELFYVMPTSCSIAVLRTVYLFYLVYCIHKGKRQWALMHHPMNFKEKTILVDGKLTLGSITVYLIVNEIIFIPCTYQ